MKKFALLMAMVLALAVTAGAQDGETMSGITAKGIKAGFNLAGHSGDGTDDGHKNLTAAAFGGFVTFTVADQFAVQPEVLFNMKGAKWEMGSDTWKGKYNYLEIPVLLKYMIPTQGSAAPSIYAGPSVGFLLTAKEDYTYSGVTVSDEDVKDFVKSTDFGIAFGAGVAIAAGSGSVTIDARYTLGMTEVYEPDPTFGDYKIKSKLLQFLLGYGF